MHASPSNSEFPHERLRKFFSGATEYTFHAHLGVADPHLVDYLSDLLTRFVRRDALFAVRAPNGKRVEQVADMLAEANAREGEAKRRLHRHIGDFTLFWVGFFPESLDKLRGKGTKDSLIDYRAQGKRAYRIASSIPASRPEMKAGVMERLSHEFELCAYGLGEIRRQWQEESDEPLGPLW